MQRILLSLFALFLAFALPAHDAEAKRMGGGKSFGMQRQATPMKRDASPQQAQNAPAPGQNAAAGAAPKRNWMGPLAGLAAGLGIAALLSHFGLGEGMANMLLILALVAVAFFVVRWLMRKRSPEAGMQYAGAAPGNAAPTNFNPAPAQFEVAKLGAGGTATSAAAANIPADFDVEGFLRQAKLSFVRLQAANDRGDMDDIREFTSPEMFAEIKMQYQERGGKSQETDVMALNAELLDVAAEEGRYVASVHFSGQLREEANAAPEAFAETWHLVKPTDGSRGWNVAGIQQA